MAKSKHIISFLVRIGFVSIVHSQQLLSTPSVIVLIGDSYASGNGAGNYDGVRGCFRSTASWGAQFAQSINNASKFINRGCSGSTFDDVSNNRFVGYVEKDRRGRCPIPTPGSDEFYTDIEGSSSCSRFVRPQLSALDSSVDLVLFAMGGNDMQFDNLFKSCLVADSRDVSDCQDQINFFRNNANDWGQQLSNVLVSMMTLLKPTAQVIVLQFPHFVLDTPYTFSDTSGNSIEITNRIRNLGPNLNSVQIRAIEMANQVANRTFVQYFNPVKSIFEGHEPHPSPFEDNINGWIYEGSAPNTSGIYQLNPIGHTELGIALKRLYVPSPPTAAPVNVPPRPTPLPVPRPNKPNSVPTPRQIIVQIGDSYASGLGARGATVGAEGCYRKINSWGEQFAKRFGDARFNNRGCYGGTFIDITNDRTFPGTVEKGNDGECPSPPYGSDEFYTESFGSCRVSVKSQLSSLDFSVDLVLFAMGRNDMNFEKLFTSCLSFGSRDVSACQNQINFVRDNANAWTQEMADVLIEMIPLLESTARVVVLQFPHFVQDIVGMLTLGTGIDYETIRY